jgi:hypothetical protein
VVEHPPNNHKVLSSNSNIIKERKREREMDKMVTDYTLSQLGTYKINKGLQPRIWQKALNTNMRKTGLQSIDKRT